MSWPGIEHLERKFCECGEPAMLPTDEPFLIIQPLKGFKISIFGKCKRCAGKIMSKLRELGIECGGIA